MVTLMKGGERRVKHGGDGFSNKGLHEHTGAVSWQRKKEEEVEGSVFHQSEANDMNFIGGISETC